MTGTIVRVIQAGSVVGTVVEADKPRRDRRRDAVVEEIVWWDFRCYAHFVEDHGGSVVGLHVRVNHEAGETSIALED